MLKGAVQRIRDAFKGRPFVVTMEELRELEGRAREIRELEMSTMRARTKTTEMADFALLTRQQMDLAKQHKTVVREYERKVDMAVRSS